MSRTGTSLVAATATHLAMSMALPPPSPTTRSQPDALRSSTRVVHEADGRVGQDAAVQDVRARRPPRASGAPVRRRHGRPWTAWSRPAVARTPSALTSSARRALAPKPKTNRAGDWKVSPCNPEVMRHTPLRRLPTPLPVHGGPLASYFADPDAGVTPAPRAQPRPQPPPGRRSRTARAGRRPATVPAVCSARISRAFAAARARRSRAPSSAHISRGRRSSSLRGRQLPHVLIREVGRQVVAEGRHGGDLVDGHGDVVDADAAREGADHPRDLVVDDHHRVVERVA